MCQIALMVSTEINYSLLHFTSSELEISDIKKSLIGQGCANFVSLLQTWGQVDGVELSTRLCKWCGCGLFLTF